MAAFLFKTEPTTYSWDDLVRERKTTWNGISNASALIHLRTVKPGDQVVIYHSGKDRAAVGLARAISGPYPDPALSDARRVVVDLEPDRALGRPVTLAAFKSDAVLRTTELVRFSRLSVMPLSSAHLRKLLSLAKA
jgi:predicted RNA-binding protein with PUA-like domain